MDHIVGLIIAITVVSIFIVVAMFLLSKIREGRNVETPSAEDLLVKFGDLYTQGLLTDEEFRAIRRTFASSLGLGGSFSPSQMSPDEAKKREQAELLERLLRNEQR